MKTIRRLGIGAIIFLIAMIFVGYIEGMSSWIIGTFVVCGILYMFGTVWDMLMDNGEG